MRTIVISALISAALISVASAQTATNAALTLPTTGWTYFNRPGATLAEHRADIQACFDPVAAMDLPNGGSMYMPQTPYYNEAYSPAVNAAGGAAGALVVASIAMEQMRQAQNRAIVANYENCMVARGWRVVRLIPAVGRRLEELTGARLEARLEPMISAEHPEGDIVRTFANDLAHPQSAPAHPDNSRVVPLSLFTLPTQDIVGDRLRRLTVATPGLRAPIDERRAAEAQERERVRRIGAVQEHVAAVAAEAMLQPIEDFSAVPSDMGLIVVSVDGEGRKVVFEREGQHAAGAAASFMVSVPTAKSGEQAADRATYVFAAPPGRWRLRAVSVGSTPVSLCMGAPAFDIAANDVVYAGAFTSSDVAPSLVLAEGQTALASAPDLAGRMHNASYVNGSVSECLGASMLYAYEIPDAPFADGYHWGSRAMPAPVAAAPAP